MGLLPGEAMSNVDAAWLHMEDRTNLMIITGVLSFYEKLEFAKLKEVIEDRFLCYDRFRQIVVESPCPWSARVGSRTSTSTCDHICNGWRCRIPAARTSSRRWSAL